MSRIPSSRRIWKKGSVASGFVKMSASWFSVLTCSNTTSPFSTWSRRKWCRISICLVRECNTGFLVRLMALVLSQKMGIRSSLRLKSNSCCLIHRIWAQQLPVATYSASAVDKATETCFLLCQLTKEFENKWQVPLVLFLSDLQPVKSESEKPTNEQSLPLEYHSPYFGVPDRYRSIRLTAFRWDSLGHDW